MNNDQDLALRETFLALETDAEAYFKAACELEFETTESWEGQVDANAYWNNLPEDLQETAKALIARLVPTCVKLAELAGASALTGDADLQELQLATKAMRAALMLRHYSYRGPDLLHDEGTVLGYRPAEQSEHEGRSPWECQKEFNEQFLRVVGILNLVDASTTTLPVSSAAAVESAKYRPNTAFIMMWMDRQNLSSSTSLTQFVLYSAPSRLRRSGRMISNTRG